MLRVYGHYKYLYSFSAGIDFRRQNLTSVYRRQILTSKVDPRTERVNATAKHTTGGGELSPGDYYQWLRLRRAY